MLSAACSSNIGKKRSNNEDNFYFNGVIMSPDNIGSEAVLQTEVSRDEDSFFAVMDGMGGYEYGELASGAAAKAAEVFFEDENSINPCDITPSLFKLCKQMNEKVNKMGNNLGVGLMGTTLVALFFHAGQTWVCNVGDSRCFLLRNGEMHQISKDHTDEEELRLRGLEGKKPRLTQYIGMDPEELTLLPHVESLVPVVGDRFLLCSDGLTDMVSLKQIRRILVDYSKNEECVSQLTEIALDGGGKDNITVMVIDIK